jgi:hypothetical protein
MKPAILLATLAFAGAASAADPVVVDKPRVAVGDTWTYNSEIRAANRSRKLVETFEVSGVTGNRLHVVVLRKFEGEAEGEPIEADMVFSDDWNVMITGNRGGRPSAIMRPSTAMLKFPMKAGERYPSDYDMETLPDANIVRHRRVTKVVGWEDVTVPAGRFRALRIEAEGTVQVAKKPKPGRTMVTVWWVPELRRWVKLEQDFGPNGHSQELVSYKLAP